MEYKLYTKGGDEIVSSTSKESLLEAKNYFKEVKRLTEEQFDKLFDVKGTKSLLKSRLKYTREKIADTMASKDYKYFTGNNHKIRLHGGKYLALGQKKPLTVYRDNNRDDNYDLDESKTDTGVFGINIHRATGRAGKTSTQVNKWSAGCQVIASNDEWHEFLDICQVAREVHGNSFSYTLLESKDLV